MFKKIREPQTHYLSHHHTVAALAKLLGFDADDVYTEPLFNDVLFGFQGEQFRQDGFRRLWEFILTKVELSLEEIAAVDTAFVVPQDMRSTVTHRTFYFNESMWNMCLNPWRLSLPAKHPEVGQRRLL
jgi:hypothetical protein